MTKVAPALSQAWGITSLPGGPFLITEKAGTVPIVSAAGTPGNAITGIPAVNPGWQGGLLGICIDPQFSTNRMLDWVFSENVGGGTVSAVAKGRPPS